MTMWRSDRGIYRVLLAMLVASLLLTGSGSEPAAALTLALPLQAAPPAAPPAAPAPGPGPAAKPALVAPGKRSAVYVLATTSDTATAIALSVEVAMNIAPKVAALAGTKDRDKVPMIIAQPTWTLDTLAQQCKQNPTTTRGAIVVGPVEIDTGTWNALIFASSYNRLAAGASLVACDASAGTLQVVWTSVKFVQGTGNQGGVPLLALGAIGALFVARTNNVTQPYTSTVNNGPTSMTQTVMNGSTSMTGPIPGAPTVINGTTTTTGATDTTTTTAAGVTNVTTTSAQAVSNGNAVVTNVAPILLTQAGTLLTQTLPGSSSTTLLKRAAASLANDVSTQLAAACSAGSSDKDACQSMFQPSVAQVASSAIPPVVLQSCAPSAVFPRRTPVAGSMDVSFVNTTTKNISIVVLRIGSTDVSDVGTFYPNQTNLWRIEALLGACSLRAVRYEDGTEWSAPAAASPDPTATPAK